MAVKKSTTSTKAAVRTSIPARDRKAVTYTRKFVSLANGKPIDDQKAYQMVLEQRRFTAARLAKERSEKKAEEKTCKRERRESAIKTLRRGMLNLSEVHCLLMKMEEGGDGYFTMEALATFARATLADTGVEIEQSLVDLDLFDRERVYYFLPDLPVEPEAQRAA
jgi:hypothetical protein